MKLNRKKLSGGAFNDFNNENNSFDNNSSSETLSVQKYIILILIVYFGAKIYFNIYTSTINQEIKTRNSSAETLNFAALHKLPILFICENNGYAIHTPISKRWATERLCERVETYGIQSTHIENQDVFEIRKTAFGLVSDMRNGSGPAFIEVKCYRWCEHVGPNSDFDQGYRSEEELAPWRKNDQVVSVGALLSPASRQLVDDEIEQRAGGFNFHH